MGFGRYVLHRLLLVVPTLFGVTLISFTLVYVLPGNPALVKAGSLATPEHVAAIERQMGLDRPVHVQYWRYLTRLLRADLGESSSTGRTVPEDFRQRVPATLELTLASLLVAAAIGIPLGVLSAVHRDTALDHASRLVGVGGVAMPSFWTGLLLLYVFFYLLGVAPPPLGRIAADVPPPPRLTGLYVIDAALTGHGTALLSALHHLMLPALTLGFAVMAPLTRMVRATMLEILESDYVKAAWAAGLPRRRVIYGDALRNALIPRITLLVVTVAALLAPWLAPYDPDEPDAAAALASVSVRHPLGTDLYGRDQLSRLIHAGRVDLLVALSATAIALTLGATLGAAAGYRGGWVDHLVMRGVDAVMAFPAFILALAITAALGNSTANVVAPIALSHVPIYTRLIRGEMLKARETEDAEAARTVGNRPHQIVLYHLFPNCVPPLIVQATLAMGFAILTVAALSFIGLGIQPPQSEWGQMTAEGAGYVVSGEWWLVLFPGLAIMLTVLAFNLVGDTLRDLLDPRMRGVR